MFYGSYLFKLIGVTVIWLAKKITSFVTNKKSDSFKMIWTGKKNEDSINDTSNELSQILLGAIVLSILLFSIVKSGI
jgi:hypothetical protein